MTALAEKLKEAGADTIGSRLTIACVEGIKRFKNDPSQAWDVAFELFGEQFIKDLMKDMAPVKSPTEELVRESEFNPPRYKEAYGGKASGMTMAVINSQALKPYTPRVISPERLEKRRELQQVIRSKYKNSAGISWSEVGWHELIALARDGKEAKALLAAGPAMVPNNGCTVGQVLGIERTDAIISEVRDNPIPVGGT